MFAQGGGQYFVFVDKGTGGFHHVVVGQGEGDIEIAIIAIEFLFHVLVGLPGKFAVVHADAGVPMHAVEVFVAVVVVHFHATADATAVEVGGKIDFEGHLLTGFEGGGQFDFEEGILDFEGDVLGWAGLVVFVADWVLFWIFWVDLDVVDDGAEFLRFILSEGDFGPILLVEFIGKRAGLHGILVEVEVGLGEGIGGVVGVDEGFFAVDDFGIFVEYGFDGIVHILLPVSLVGFFIFPVVGVIGRLVGDG